MKELEKTKPVVLMGDLNVAHLDMDIYNVTVSVFQFLSMQQP